MIWAVQNGYVDDVPVERIKEFQAGWTDFLTTRKTDLLGKIGAEKVLSKELTAHSRLPPISSSRRGRSSFQLYPERRVN